MSMMKFDPAADDGTGAYEPVLRSTSSFAPRRLPAHEVFHNLNIDVEADGVDCRLIDLNFEYMAITSRTKVQIGEQKTLVIRASALDNKPIIFESEGEVVEVSSDSFGSDYELKFTSFIDIDQLTRDALKLNTRQVLSEDLGIKADALPNDYAILSIELMHHLCGLRAKAAVLEDNLNSSTTDEVFNGARRLMTTYGEEFRNLWYRFNDIIGAIPYNDPRFHAIKWHTDNVLRPYFMGAPVFARSYEKPLGYPGDFQIMLYAYDSTTPIKTPTLYDSVLQQYFSHGFGACIRGRLALTIEAILENLKGAETTSEQPYEILNVGCGAAVELPELLGNKVAREKFMHVRLLDQDDRPLQYAYQNVAKATFENKLRKKITAYKMSFVELYQSGRLTQEQRVGPQDVIYSLGLLDYFKQSRAKLFVTELYKRVKPGGLLIICNVAKTREGCEWVLECLTDWRLEYRTKFDMEDMFSDLPGQPHISIRLEDSGQMWVAVVEKPV